MELYFLRHAEAEERRPGRPDEDRALTEKGRRQAERAAQWLRKRGVKLEAIVSSPLLRAVQTAEPVAGAYGMELEEDERLAGGGLAAGELRGIARDLGGPESVLLVGHEPDFSLAVESLTGEYVVMKKAAAALVEGKRIEPGEMRLAWVVTSKEQG